MVGVAILDGGLRLLVVELADFMEAYVLVVEAADENDVLKNRNYKRSKVKKEFETVTKNLR